MHQFTFRSFIFILVILNCPVAAQIPNSIQERKFLSTISQSRLLKHVDTLCSFGNRQGGTPSARNMVKYLTREFRSYGLETVILNTAERLSYIERNSSLYITQGKKRIRLHKKYHLAPFSPSSPMTRAPLIWFREESQLQESSLHGKVVILERQIRPTLYKSLVRSGALAIISYHSVGDHLPQNLVYISHLPEENDNEIPAFIISQKDGRALDSLANIKPLMAQFKTETEISPRQIASVLATLPGKSEEYILVCAHGDSDSGGPGADDNASGIAVVLEMARCFASAIRSGLIKQPEMTLKFAVWGKEYYSAEEFLRGEKDNIEMLNGVLNYDQIGYGETRKTLYIESNDYSANRVWARLFQKQGERYAGEKGYWREVTTVPSLGGTDAYAFKTDRLRELGLPDNPIPAITLFSAAWNQLRELPQTEGWNSPSWKGPRDTVLVDYNPYYHTTSDIPALTTWRQPYRLRWGTILGALGLLQIAWGNE